ncbi:MoaD/ThiS family protein [Clostridium paraputrificum]|uniref:MoaD/ThiS family protein n=1 Tax=Clostridium paraputrificum TaxID=29363 RepID=UPI003D34D405
MKITIKYLTLFRKITGKSREEFVLKEECTLQEFIINHICAKYENINEYIMDNNKISKRATFFVDNDQVDMDKPLQLKDNTIISVVTQIQGG